MSNFWLFGIVLNVGLTLLAAWWVVRQMKPRQEDTVKEQPKDS